MDNVNHPAHYTRENAIECIDELELVFGREAVKIFCLCNAWKYRYRAADKNGLEDLKKSDWYMRKFLELNLNTIPPQETPEDENFVDLNNNNNENSVANLASMFGAMQQ